MLMLRRRRRIQPRPRLQQRSLPRCRKQRWRRRPGRGRLEGREEGRQGRGGKGRDRLGRTEDTEDTEVVVKADHLMVCLHWVTVGWSDLS